MIVPYKLLKPRNEVVGIIEESGRQVKNLKVGDRVFGPFTLLAPLQGHVSIVRL